MPKTPKPIPKKPKKSFFKNKRFLTVAGVVIVLLTGYYTYHQYQLNEKHKVEVAEFAKLETRMQKTMDQIVATVGQPYELHHGQGCSYTALKYERGPLDCTNYFSYVYSINSVAQGRELTIKLIDKLKKVYKNTDLTEIDSSTLRANSTSGDIRYFADQNKIGCFISYDFWRADVYNSDTTDNLKKQINSAFAAEYEFGCYGYPTKPVYKVVTERY